MVTKGGESMPIIDRKGLLALDRKAEGLLKIWMSEREEKRSVQRAVNAEVRRRWIESDSTESGATSAAEHRKETDHDSRDSSG